MGCCCKQWSSFPLPKTQQSFCSFLALKWTSSKQITRTKPFPPAMISSPLDQPTESAPPAATQVTRCSIQGTWTLPLDNRCQYPCIPSTARALLWGSTSYMEVANWSALTLTANIPVLPLGEATAQSAVPWPQSGKARREAQISRWAPSSGTWLPAEGRGSPAGKHLTHDPHITERQHVL